MDLQNIKSIIAKDLDVFRRKKGILRTVVILPLVYSIGIPILLVYLHTNNRAPFSVLVYLIPSFSFFYVVLASLSPTQIASYSLIGEKVNNSLEPLLATPLTGSEILLGKALVSFLPSIIAIYFSASVFMVLVDVLLDNPGYYFLPSWNFLFIITIMVPLTIIFSIETSIIISSKANDERTASSLGSALMIPFAAIYVLSEVQVIVLNQITLYTITLLLLLFDTILALISRILFQREEILTKWN